MIWHTTGLRGTPKNTSFRIVEQNSTSAIYRLENGLGCALAVDLARRHAQNCAADLQRVVHLSPDHVSVSVN